MSKYFYIPLLVGIALSAGGSLFANDKTFEYAHYVIKVQVLGDAERIEIKKRANGEEDVLEIRTQPREHFFGVSGHLLFLNTDANSPQLRVYDLDLGRLVNSIEYGGHV